MSFTKREQNQLYENGWVEFASLREVIGQNWALDESDREDALDIPAWSFGDFFSGLLKLGEVTFVTGLNGSGMTSVALNTALAFAMQRSGTVVIHSLDQHPKYLAARLLNSAFGIPLSSLTGAESTEFCLPTYVERLLQFDISIDGRPYESLEAIKTCYEAMEALGLMVVNDMNHFPFGIAKRENAAYLKAMAQNLEIPVLVASATMMLDIREQDISWWDLDAVISLSRIQMGGPSGIRIQRCRRCRLQDHLAEISLQPNWHNAGQVLLGAPALREKR